MKRRKRLNSGTYRTLVVVAALFMVILLPQVPVQGAGGGGTDPCTSYSMSQDRDNDGFTDYDECKGITFAGSAGGTFPGSSSSKTARANRLDPSTRDLFVVLIPAASGGYFGSLTNPLEYILNTRLAGGLEIYTHQILYTKVATDRTVCKSITGYPCTIPTGQTVKQKAVQVTESVDPGSGTTALILGSSPSMHGTPNDTDLATVYTVRIKNHLQSTCGCSDILTSCTQCCDNATQTPACGRDLFYKYIKHTIAHEIAHQIVLTTGYDAKLGWHYPEDSRVELDYQVHHDGNTFYVGTTFTGADQDGYRLK